MRSSTTALGLLTALSFAAAAAFALTDEAASAEPTTAQATARAGTAAVPGSDLACYDAAREATLLDENRAQTLCRGSNTIWPARCYEAARERTFLSSRRAISLCQCARSLRPVTCFEDANREADLSESELVDMCSAQRLNQVVLPYCTSAIRR